MPDLVSVNNLLAVYGSPRKGGNTSILLDYFLEGVAGAAGASPGGMPGGSAVVAGAPPGAVRYRIERVHLRDLTFSHCTECDRCVKTGVCVIEDDMSGYYDKLLSYERIVMALPVFFLGPPATAKAFIDRAQSLWVRKHTLGIRPERRSGGGGERKGYMLSVGGFRGSDTVFNCNRSVVKAFYMSCGFKYSGELLVTGVDHIGEIKKVENIRERAREAGRECAA